MEVFVVKKSQRRRIDGDELVSFFFHDLFEHDDDLAARLPLRMLTSMAIWLPLDVYHDHPVLLPWVVRDPTCRADKKRGRPEEWSSPNAAGYLRDDNSLIKNIPKSLEIRAHRQHLAGARIGNKFVAGQVWRNVEGDDLASRSPLLNSFVPNLVWLPKQIAALKNREGSPIQTALQGLAWAIYRNAPVADHLKTITERAWEMIPPPTTPTAEPDGLVWFESTPRFFATRSSGLKAVIDALDRLDAGEELVNKVVTDRYTAGLPHVDAARRRELHNFLSNFVAGDHVGYQNTGGVAGELDRVLTSWHRSHSPPFTDPQRHTDLRLNIESR